MSNHKIIKQTKNPFMQRDEYVVELTAEKNPSFDEVTKVIGKDAELTVVKLVKGNFGSSSFNAEVFVYNSKEAKDKVEKLPRKQRLKVAEQTAAKAAATSQAAKAAAGGTK